MKAKRFITVLLCIVMTLSLVLTACQQGDDPSDEQHVCESECPICLLCTNLDCQEDACRRKCHGNHTPTSDDPDDAADHEHTFDMDTWAFDSTNHWHPATCSHTEEKKDLAAHNLNNDGVCSVCKQQVYSKSGNWTVYTATGSVQDGMTMSAAPASYPADSIVMHYRRITSNDYPHWGFWLWAAGTDGERFPLQYQDEFGGVAVVPLSKVGGKKDGKIGLIPINDNKNSGDSWYKKDTASADRSFVPGVYEQSDGCYHMYFVEGDSNIYKTAAASNAESLNFGLSARFTDKNNITIDFATPVSKVEIYDGDALLGSWMATTGNAGKIGYVMENDADISHRYNVKAQFVKDNKSVDGGVDISCFYGLADFAETYYYEGDDLGAVLGPNSTTFKVWSPVSSKMVLNLYNEGDGGDPYETHEMTLGDYGVWEYTANTRLAGKYYTYTVYNFGHPGGMEVCDPYAKSAGLNGVRGMVVNFNSGLATPDNWDTVKPLPYDANELVIWETHVADVTSSPTWGGDPKLAKTFLGMIQTGTTYSKGGTTVKTGFDHIVELGVNAVQLIPVFDQFNEEEAQYRAFNWGYNPLNYNVLEGSYSSNPNDGYVRIREFRQLVQAFNSKGINIIMDVVYNHVNDAGSSNFDALVPGYYFRHNADGTRSSGSGCGNDTMSERPMMRKFMIDSVCFLAETYKLGGFRFDIMGLHDVETMNMLTEAVRRINPNMIIFGEAWDSNSHNTASTKKLAGQSNANSFAAGLGQFNDRMRDQIAYFAAGKSYDSKRIEDGLRGITTEITDDPYKTVNYATCHDGYTLADRFKLDASVVTNTSPNNRKKCAMLTNSMVLTSNGISFLLAGEEMLRSKYELGATGEQIHNSYNAPYEVNALDYSLKITNADMLANYQKLIAFKKMFVDDFGLNSMSNILNTNKYKVNLSNGVFWIDIYATNGTHWVVAHAGPNGSGTLSGSTVYLSTTGNNSSTLQPYETKIVRA